MYQIIIKKLIDFLCSLILILLLSPMIILITFALLFANQGKPFFFQTRPGKHGKLFNIIKFKTMNDKKDSSGNLLSDEIRLTKIGKFVRKTSIDELPQLINVLMGHMSLVGPRPLLPQYLPLYNDSQQRRHLVKPGMTGWAQINGRNAISWEQKFEYDVWYVDNLSLKLDIKIVLLTIKKVVISEGVSSKDNITMDEFLGN
jgi:lipopolysaccharide/colanic/teichoic acid biosynthesis glycosyltransferase